jgi:ornithine decarboxylase
VEVVAPGDRDGPSVLWGATCDSADVLAEGVRLPRLRVGDWLRVDGMGAYSRASASRFNGFELTEAVYVE